MYCESCGSFIPDGQVFCSNCGSPAPQPAPEQAAQPAVQQTVQPAAEPASAPAPAPQAIPVQPAYQQPAYQQPAYQQPAYQQPAAQPVQPMYQQPMYAAQPVGAAPLSQAPVKSSNAPAVVGMIFGILAFILFWIPVFNIITTALFGLLGLIFSIVGLVKKNAKGKAMAVVGLVLTILATILTIGFYVLLGTAIASDPELSQEFEEIFEVDDIAYTYDDSEYLITDGYIVNADNGYVSGVLHIDGFTVEF